MTAAGVTPHDDLAESPSRVSQQRLDADTSRWSMTRGAGGGSSSFGAGSEAGGGSSGASFVAGGGAGGGYPQHVADAIAAIPEREREIVLLNAALKCYSDEQAKDKAEIKRLRARVAELEAAMREIIKLHSHKTGCAETERIGKAALAAKPTGEESVRESSNN